MSLRPRDPAITLEPSRGAHDEKFVNVVIAASRAGEFAHLDPQTRERMLDLQVAAQRRHYLAGHPTAMEHIVREEGLPVGRALIAETAERISLVDLALLPSHQSRGIGSTALRLIMSRADDRALPLRVSVWGADDRLHRWYTRHGFIGGARSSTHVEFTRPTPRMSAA